MKLKNFYLIGFALLGIWSCNNDDDGPPGEIIPPRLLSEVAVEDDAEIVAFLKTHFYNYEEFEAQAPGFDFKVKFDTIAGVNEDKTSIFDRPELITETISLESASLGRSDGEVIDVNLYVLVARQGLEDGTPTIGDNVVLRYEGSFFNGQLFDASTNQPIVFNLSQVVRGFGNGLEYFQTGTGPMENGDGTISYEDFGIGAIFIPSGLAYFDGSGPGGTIPSYTPLIFKVDAFAYEVDTDLDGDGIPSILEDLDMNGSLNNDNTDSESEALVRLFNPNYLDTDDDGDGIPTIDEIDLDSEGNFLGFRDTDGDGVSDHLDNDL